MDASAAGPHAPDSSGTRPHQPEVGKSASNGTQAWVSLYTLSEEFLHFAGSDDPEDRRRRGDMFRAHLAQFEHTHGPLVDFHFCSQIPAACVHTAGLSKAGSSPDERLHIAFPPNSVAPEWVVELLHGCQGLHVEIRQLLYGQDRLVCLEMLSVLAVQLLRLMDVFGVEHWPGPGKPRTNASQPSSIPAAVRESNGTEHPRTGDADAGSRAPLPAFGQRQRVYERELSGIRDLFLRSAQRRARITYFLGILIGAGALAGLLGLLSLLLLPTHELLLLSLAVGGVGAIVSVMQRMTQGDLSLQYGAGRPTLLLVGAFRAWIGAVFAGVLCGLLITGLIPFKQPVAASMEQLYFFGAIAFFAGFSERWAQDMLAYGQQQVIGRDQESTRATA